MIEGNRVDDHKLVKIILVWHVVAVPSDDIKRGVILCCRKQCSLELRHYIEVTVDVFVRRSWSEEVTRISKAICSNRTKVRQLEMTSENLGNITARRFGNGHRKPHASLNYSNFIWRNVKNPKLGFDRKCSSLWNNQKITICVGEGPLVHRRVASVHINRHAMSRAWIACACHSLKSFNKINGGTVRWHFKRAPSHLVRVGLPVTPSVG
mmetsp:Transcript_212/g.558  ORF Transcript_212/g.558 Transcript_212/m.558 type:complete len:209 (-) Transcript_212:403-1029(-)